MRTIQTQISINSDRQLNFQLPEDIKAGQYQIVIVMNSQGETTKSSSSHTLNQLAGKITAFNNLDAVSWQKAIREEWDLN